MEDFEVELRRDFLARKLLKLTEMLPSSANEKEFLEAQEELESLQRIRVPEKKAKGWTKFQPDPIEDSFPQLVKTDIPKKLDLETFDLSPE